MCFQNIAAFLIYDIKKETSIVDDMHSETSEIREMRFILAQFFNQLLNGTA